MAEMITVELEEQELLMLSASTSALMKMISDDIAKHRNHKDYSMDKLFALMEMFANTGTLWVKIQKAQGISQEMITEYLAEQEK
jgi:hypothetical protein